MEEDEKKSACPVSGKKCCAKKLLFVLLVLAAFVAMHSVYTAASIFASYEITAPAATAATACPTTDTLTGDSEYQTAPTKSAASAIASANSLLQSRADTQAGLAKNGYSCPNPACTNKRLGAVTATPDPGYPKSSRTTLFAVLATIFNAEARWSGLMEYSWSAKVTCS